MNFNDQLEKKQANPMAELVELIQALSPEEAIELIKKVKERHEWQTYLRLAQKFEGKEVVRFVKEKKQEN